MPIPLSTTTITVFRPSTTPDYDTPYSTTTNSAKQVASRVRATLSSPSGSAQMVQFSEQEQVSLTFISDLCDVVYTDQVRDDNTGLVYNVRWVTRRQGLGMDYLVIGVQQDVGSAYA